MHFPNSGSGRPFVRIDGRSGVVAGVPLLVFTRLPCRLRLLFMNRVVSVGAILVIALDQFSEAPNRAITRVAPTGHFFTGT